MLEINNLSKHFGKRNVLSHMSFSVDTGEIIGLVGENGAGKSTLLKILSTLETQDEGSITFNNESYKKNKQNIRKQIGFVPQDIAVWEDFSVKENMLFFEKLGWKNKDEAELKQLCLDMNLDRWHEKVKKLSGGMKRKLNLAISLIHDPSLLLLDEPTVGIDLKSKKEIALYLENLARNENKTIIYTSHDMDEIIHLCDWILCIGDDPFYENVLHDAGKKTLTIMHES